jgi:hypothetical protein
MADAMRLPKVSDEYDRTSVPPGMSPSDMRKLLLYRSEVFGGPMSVAFQATLRGPSDWSAGERELMAAYVSVQNQCPF